MIFEGTSIDGQKKFAAVNLISLYNSPPDEEISIDEFELFALDRLALLRGIEVLKARTSDAKELSSKIGMV